MSSQPSPSKSRRRDAAAHRLGELALRRVRPLSNVKIEASALRASSTNVGTDGAGNRRRFPRSSAIPLGRARSARVPPRVSNRRLRLGQSRERGVASARWMRSRRAASVHQARASNRRPICSAAASELGRVARHLRLADQGAITVGGGVDGGLACRSSAAARFSAPSIAASVASRSMAAVSLRLERQRATPERHSAPCRGRRARAASQARSSSTR